MCIISYKFLLLFTLAANNGDEIKKAVFRVPGVVARRLAARAARKAAEAAAMKQNEALAGGKATPSVSRKVVRWLELIRRRVEVPSDVLDRRPETEALVIFASVSFS